MQSGNFIRNNIKNYHNVIYAASSTATLRLFQTNLWVNADQRVCLGVELLLEGNNNSLEVLYRLVLDVIGHLKGTRGKLWAELMKGFPSQTAINTSAANRPCQCLCCPRRHQSHPGQRRGQVCSWKARTGFEDDVQRRRVFFLKSRLELPVNCKEQRQGSDGLLSSRQVVHGPEPLPWSHTVVVDSIQIGLLGVLRAQESLQEAHAGRFNSL